MVTTIAAALLACLGLASAAGGETVAVFDNPSYTDSGQESLAVSLSLSTLGHSTVSFSGIAATDWTAATANADALVIPELETGDLLSDLDAAARTAIRDYVANGGKLVMFGTSAGPGTIAMLNGIFGFALAGGSPSGPSSLDSAAATGTKFAGGPATLPDSTVTEGVATASLPGGALDLYDDGAGVSTVFVADVARGQVVFLGFDWFESPTPAAWEQVLDSAVAFVRFPLVRGYLLRASLPPPPRAVGFGRAVGSWIDAPFGEGAFAVVGAPLTPGAAGQPAAGRVYLFASSGAPAAVPTLEGEPPVENALFGAALAATSDGVLLIGAPGEIVRGVAGAGAVHLLVSGSADRLRVEHPDPLAGASFGASLARSSSRQFVIGAPASGQAGSSGAAYVLDLTPGSTPRELPRPQPSPGALFGAAAARGASDSTAVVAAPFEDTGQGRRKGAVYLFNTDTSAPSFGALLRTFRNPRPAQGTGAPQEDGFGSAVATGAGLLVVGAPLADTLAAGAGEVHVFDFDSASSTYGERLATICHPDPTVDAAFGTALAVAGTRLLVGAPFDDEVDARDSGAVYTFDLTQLPHDVGSAVPSCAQGLTPARLRLPNPTNLEGLRFGVAMGPVGSAGDILVGAPGQPDDDGVAQVLAVCGNFIEVGEECDREFDCVPGFCTVPYCGQAIPPETGRFAVAAAQVVNRCDCSATMGQQCDDLISCTENDRCTGVGIECTGTPNDSRCADDGNACTVERCLARFGCTRTPRDCNDGDPCTMDSCNPSGNPADPCTHVRSVGCRCDTGEQCDDRDPCNGVERCFSCRGCDLYVTGRPCCGEPRTCNIELPPLATGTSCDDGVACTRDDQCTAGTNRCTGVADHSACDDGNGCTVDTCDPALRGCTNPFLPDCDPRPPDPCASCDDADPCTVDTCVAGACAHAPLAGFDAVQCGFQFDGVEQCTDQAADGVMKRLERAERLIEKARAARRSRQRKLVGRMLQILAEAKKVARRNTRSEKITGACGEGLRQLIDGLRTPARDFLAAAKRP